jgi:hypothetical protein
MSRRRLAALPLLLLSCAWPCGCASAPRPPQLQVFILTGQSNMVGAGKVKADPKRNGGKGSLELLVRAPESRAEFAALVDERGAFRQRDDVFIWRPDKHGPLTVGYGGNADAIGPELGFGHAVGDRITAPVLLVKVAWGGKSLGKDFRPPSAGGEVGPNYRELFAAVRTALDNVRVDFPALAFDGIALRGIGWHQGWNDRIHQPFVDAYEENLCCFIRDARAELGAPNLPFVIAETGMSGRSESHPRALALMQAQANVAQRAEFDGNVAFVGTRDFYRPKEESPSGQAYHWNNNAETYWRIGAAMGHALLELPAAAQGGADWPTKPD